MSVIPLHVYPQVVIVYRDRTERVPVVLHELDPEDGLPGMLCSLGYRVCGRCGSWCEPVRVMPDVGCGRCELQQLTVQVQRGLHLQETAEELALRIYRYVIWPAAEPPGVS